MIRERLVNGNPHKPIINATNFTVTLNMAFSFIKEKTLKMNLLYIASRRTAQSKRISPLLTPIYLAAEKLIMVSIITRTNRLLFRHTGLLHIFRANFLISFEGIIINLNSWKEAIRAIHVMITKNSKNIADRMRSITVGIIVKKVRKVNVQPEYQVTHEMTFQ